MRPTPVIHDSVNLIQNKRSNRPQYPPAGFGSEQQIQRLGRGNENVRRLLNERLPLRCTSIARANFSTHLNLTPFGLAQQRANPRQRLLQIFANIVAQRLERRDVNNVRFIRQITLRPFAKQHIERSEERR